LLDVGAASISLLYLILTTIKSTSEEFFDFLDQSLISNQARKLGVP